MSKIRYALKMTTALRKGGRKCANGREKYLRRGAARLTAAAGGVVGGRRWRGARARVSPPALVLRRENHSAHPAGGSVGQAGRCWEAVPSKQKREFARHKVLEVLEVDIRWARWVARIGVTRSTREKEDGSEFFRVDPLWVMLGSGLSFR